ncbi:HAD family hydrolase [Limimaricola variabilis]|nr:HAD-IA family hydrolase [Limimaricola variabilis]
MLDVDGVLVFGRPTDGQHWMVGLLDDLGISPRDLAREFIRAEWQSVVIGQKELMPTLREALIKIGTDVSAETLVSYWYEQSSRVVPDVLADVRDARCRGIPVYLATNQSYSRADYLLNKVGLNSEIDGVVYSAMAGHQKPDAGFYRFAEERAGYNPDELLLVDDKLENVEAAISAGWNGVHWSDGDSLTEILKRHIG